ncbi:hypothetical protein B0A49_11945 [Cryomyces minteri]|uniref:Uncharacterized protein n=1 Tax=Cryomyces minteri TaxID=331657 RepID=A0A4U0W935_9PEZI|nr:hypothetical protein B0A49_11945 [Cryomyces minteri]
MVVVKIRDPDMSSQLRSQRPNQLKDRMNNALKEQTNINIQKFAEDWVGVWGREAQVIVPTYGVLVHGVQTKFMDPSDMTKAMRLLQAENAPRMPRAEIKYVGWLTKSAVNKKNSTLIVEFTRPEDANEAINWGMELSVKHHKHLATAPARMTPRNALRRRIRARIENARHARDRTRPGV